MPQGNQQKLRLKQFKLRVIVPFPNIDNLFSSIAIRDMRDYNHFTEILPALAMLKLFQRPIAKINDQYYLLVTIDDVKAAKALFDEIEETTKKGTEKRIIDFYETIVKSHVNGATLETIVEESTATTIEEIKQLAEQGYQKLDEVDGIHVYRRPKKYNS
jgi:hypothetical protein